MASVCYFLWQLYPIKMTNIAKLFANSPFLCRLRVPDSFNAPFPTKKHTLFLPLFSTNIYSGADFLLPLSPPPPLSA